MSIRHRLHYISALLVDVNGSAPHSSASSCNMAQALEAAEGSVLLGVTESTSGWAAERLSGPCCSLRNGRNFFGFSSQMIYTKAVLHTASHRYI